MARLDRGKIKSGLPRKFAGDDLNGIFNDLRIASHFFSAPVPLERTERIIWLRLDLENMSVTVLLG